MAYIIQMNGEPRICKADADLIASAPDLLAENEKLREVVRVQTEALKECLEDISEKRSETFLQRKKDALEHWIAEIKKAIKTGEKILK